MKYVVGFLMISITSLIISCNALKNITFYQNFNESVPLPQQSLTSATDTFVTPDIPTNIESTMKANNTSTSLVQSVMLQDMTLTITAPAGQTFGALRDIRIFILTDSLPAVEIANQYNIPATGDTLNMNVDNTQLKPYLISNSFRMMSISTNNKAITSSMTLNIFLRFQFKANLLAAL